jgi:hypothetical protein
MFLFAEGKMLKIADNLSLPVEAAKIAAIKRATKRIWRKIIHGEPNECWIWTAALDTDGYGQIRVAGKLIMATHAIFVLANDRLPTLVMHKCDNPPCCNPSHLIDGTKALNNQDKMSKGRHRPSFGNRNGARLHPDSLPRGDRHYARTNPERLARGERSGMAKLTDDQVVKIRTRFANESITKTKLAQEFGIGQSQVGRILRGESRKFPC